MNVTKKTLNPVPPPYTITIELSQAEAEELRYLCYHMSVGVELRLQGPICSLADDGAFNGHAWKYKRLTDALNGQLCQQGVAITP